MSANLNSVSEVFVKGSTVVMLRANGGAEGPPFDLDSPNNSCGRLHRDCDAHRKDRHRRAATSGGPGDPQMVSWPPLQNAELSSNLSTG